MNVLKRIARAIRPKTHAVRVRVRDSREGQRGFESSKTNRLNQAHWADANGGSINTILFNELATERNRCAYEAYNNPFVKGVINTHVTSIVGKNGPSLQVESENEAFNKAVEAKWRKWWRRPDINGKYSGAAFLRQWVKSWWINGEWLFQVLRPESGGVFILNIDPRRLVSAFNVKDPALEFMGITSDENGKPTFYNIEKDPTGIPGQNAISTTDSPPIPAEFIFHFFVADESEQKRGYPLLAVTLNSVADSRDYDTQVLDAARSAADQGVLLFTEDSNGEYLDADESVEIERRTIETMPPGWRPFQMKPEQPMQSYKEFRSEHHRDIGRPVSMPLMLVRVDSSGHNYSSARFDGQMYQRSIESFEGEIEDETLDPLVEIQIDDGVLNEDIPIRPEEYSLIWTWEKPPHVDPAKEAKGEELRLKNKSTSLIAVAKASGTTIEKVIAEEKRVKELRAEAGLDDDDTDDDDEGNTDEQD